MAGIAEVQSALAQEKADLLTLTGLIAQLLAAFAGGNLTPAAAQALLDEITDDDSTVKSSIASITAALPAVPPAVPPAA